MWPSRPLTLIVQVQKIYKTTYGMGPVPGYSHERPLSCSTPGVPPIHSWFISLGTSKWYKYWVFLSDPSGPLKVIISKEDIHKSSKVCISFMLTSMLLSHHVTLSPTPFSSLWSTQPSLDTAVCSPNYHSMDSSSPFRMFSLSFLQCTISKVTHFRLVRGPFMLAHPES